MSRCTPSREMSGPCPPSRPAILSISSRETMPESSTRSTATRGTRALSKQARFFFLHEVVESFGDLKLALARALRKQAGEHVAQAARVHLFRRLVGEDL